MDEQLKQNITKAYESEYFDAAREKQPGRLGKLMRWSARQQKKWGNKAGGNVDSIISFVMILGGFIAALTSGMTLPFIVGIVAVVGYLTAIIAGTKKIRVQARKDISEDIESGTLLTRYKAEVLDKRVGNSMDTILN